LLSSGKYNLNRVAIDHSNVKVKENNQVVVPIEKVNNASQLNLVSNKPNEIENLKTLLSDKNTKENLILDISILSALLI
jgi:hypothetical protein